MKHKLKKHFQFGPITTVCGVHFATDNYIHTENFDAVTCGNCIRKALVFRTDLTVQRRREKSRPKINVNESNDKDEY